MSCGCMVRRLARAFARCPVRTWAEGSGARQLAWRGAGVAAGKTGIAVLPVEHGFRGRRARGDRRAGHSRRPTWCRAAGARKRAADFLSEVASLNAGDIVVHVDHGIAPLHRPEGDRGRRRAARLPRTPLRRRRQSCSCRSKISSFCRATDRKIPKCRSTSSAASAGRRARRG